MKIGLVVAIEMDSIFAYYGQPEALDCPPGFHVYHIQKNAHDIYVIHTGMGEIASAGGVQYLCTKYGVELIVNFGVVGGLTPDMKKHKVCVIDRVVHYKYDCSEFMDLKVGQVAGQPSVFLPTDGALVEQALRTCPDLMRATCCSGDKFIGSESEKLLLYAQFEGDVCDMESAGIVLTAQANGVPCLLLKAVSDGLAGGAREFYDELLDAATSCLSVTDKVIESL